MTVWYNWKINDVNNVGDDKYLYDFVPLRRIVLFNFILIFISRGLNIFQLLLK